MRKQFRKIIKGLCTYRHGLLSAIAKDLTKEQFKVTCGNYHISFHWPFGAPFGTLQVATIDKITVFELSHASDYTKYENVERRLINLIFYGTTDNAHYIRNVIEEILFPSV